jgi:hypothetical protein
MFATKAFCLTVCSVKTYRLETVLHVLYGCETWFLTLIEKHRLRLFEDRVLRRIFGPKRDKVAGDWRRLHNEELHNLYTSSNVITLTNQGG